MRLPLVLIVLVFLLQSCNDRQYEYCPSNRRIGDWGVVDHTHTFGEYDSLYYLVNPIGNVNDTVFYNGNYTDSYYHSDPVRVMLQYTLSDSIRFSLERLYLTQTNPMHIVMTFYRDSLKDKKVEKVKECTLHLSRKENNDNLYYAGPDSLFKELLRKDLPLYVMATNTNSSSEPQGSQNYEFTLYPAGFDQALQMADSLNKARLKAQKTDTIPKTH